MMAEFLNQQPLNYNASQLSAPKASQQVGQKRFPRQPSANKNAIQQVIQPTPEVAAFLKQHKLQNANLIGQQFAFPSTVMGEDMVIVTDAQGKF